MSDMTFNWQSQHYGNYYSSFASIMGSRLEISGRAVLGAIMEEVNETHGSFYDSLRD